ncbi:MAG: 1-deoxy-D-xylulose-5-phosphate synthase [Actinobacteria bacterium 13_2_20CM_2_71_6]|nr:MAG: 1-deoxy-D-xylulose-5-phosphate synthase [Actinobacteria bacterium 13_2_20CM_2_71_6]
MTVLETIHGPAGLTELDGPALTALAAEIRQFLVEKVTRTGGHLGPNLGVVELTIALHRVFDSPYDRLLFDTGHQAYVHKILTGRRADFDRLRQAGGLSGYPSREESEHDLVESSHASAALSYADGLAKAHALRGEHDRRIVVVVGDGALTGGMSWEALNNIGGAPQRPVIVVLNDNGRSYAPTVGGLAAHLLVHCVTRKGHGYRPAEADQADHMHGVGVLDPVTGRPATPPEPTWTSVFGEEIVAIGERRPDVVCLTAAMPRPVGLQGFATRFPERTFDVGIAEQHAVASAAGLALGGLHPVVAVYATFANRAFDQILMDVALHRLPVTFVLDRAGITGEDGPSHHGMWDLSVMQAVPGLRIAAPRDPATLRQLLREAVDTTDGPTMIRFPKAAAHSAVPAVDHLDGVDVLHAASRPDVLLVAVGPLAADAVDAAAALERRGIGVTVVDPRWVCPVAPGLIRLAGDHRLVVTAEDNGRAGGVGSHLAMALQDSGVTTPVRSLGLPRRFLDQGRREDILAAGGLDATGIAATVAHLFPPVPHRPWPDHRFAVSAVGNAGIAGIKE